MKFNKYPKLARFGRREVANIENGETSVFPKLDGTNAQVYIQEGVLKAGRRNGEIKDDKEIKGFYKYVRENEDDAWNKFYVFDIVEHLGTNDEGEPIERFLSYEEYKPLLEKYNVSYVPRLAKLTNGDYSDFENIMNSNDWLIKEGEGYGEGVVIKRYDYVNPFGRTTWAKMIHLEYKNSKQKKEGPRNKKKTKNMVIGEIEQAILDKYCTESFIEKEFNKIKLMNDGYFEGRDIPKLLEQVWKELLEEEMFNIVVELKNPVIDFKVLNRLVINKIKEVKSEVF